MIPLSLTDTFRFSCSEDNPCFNECCKDLNQFLTPYDILRLKNHLGISSGVFLSQFTYRHKGPESGLPIITLKTERASEFKCPFVTSSGCSVYEDRPSSCRTYPLARVVSRSRETGRITEQYMVLKEPHCLGFSKGKMWTVQEWIEDQGAAAYNKMNDMLMDVISIKNRSIQGPLDIKSEHIFSMACYDLDKFRTHIFENGILDDLNLSSDILNSVKHDDTALLKLGIQWVKQILLSEV